MWKSKDEAYRQGYEAGLQAGLAKSALGSRSFRVSLEDCETYGNLQLPLGEYVELLHDVTGNAIGYKVST